MSATVGVVCYVGLGPERGGRARNDDNYLVCDAGQVAYRDGDRERVRPVEGSGTLLAVADGMGVLRDGDVAASVAVRVMAKLYGAGHPADAERALRRYLLDAHRQLHAQIGDPPQLGTTLTVAWLLDGRVAWAHVGNSRLYLYRSGALRQLSVDQTRAEFARRDNTPVHGPPDALAQGFILGSRGLGADGGLRIDAGIDSGTEVLQRGDRVLLCSDGLTGAVADAFIADVLANTPDPQAAAVACAERAVARGGRDNITVLVARVDAP